MRVIRYLVATVIVGAASAAAAQPMSQRDAQKQLFPTRGTSVTVSDTLSATDQDIIRRTIDLLREQLGGPVKYYASIAYSPDEGLLSEALQSAGNFHSLAAADAAAISACNKARASGTQGCKIAGRVLPRGYEARDLTLSFDATSAFRQAYRRAQKPKAFAMSESTGAYGIGNGAEAALGVCGASDCRVVVAD
jgi:hypothetical protein